MAQSVGGGSNRWWGPSSGFPWEEEALRHVQQHMPRTEPYRAWQTFTFTGPFGHIREVDLLVATPGGLRLVEIKSHPGRLTNSGAAWTFRAERTRTIDNPLHLTNQKAKDLRSQLEWAARKRDLKVRIPFVSAAVFLSAPDLRCELDEIQRQHVYGREDGGSGLPRIWSDLLGVPARSDRERISPHLSKALPQLLDEIGVRGLRKHDKIGPWQIEPRPHDVGPTWEDYLAENTSLPGDYRRVRIYLSELGASKDERESTRRAARREYLALQGIDHPGIVKADQFSDEHEAGPAVVFQHRREWMRLDHYMAQYGEHLSLDTRLDMARQLAEALDHAHRRHLYHRALAPSSVYVECGEGGARPRLRVGGWQTAARTPATSSHGTPDGGNSPGGRSSPLHSQIPGLVAQHVEAAAAPYLAPETSQPGAEGVPLDVFGLGSLSYLLFTGAAPSESRSGLLGRLADEGGLVPSAAWDGVAPAVDMLVRDATRAEFCDRYESVREFFDYLEVAEDELTASPEDDQPDLLETVKPGAAVGSWRIEKVLGKGSTARAFVATRVSQQGQGQQGQGQPQRVLKVALNERAEERLTGEARVLRELNDSHVVRYIDGPMELGRRLVVVLERAGETTLGEHLRKQGRLSIDELERFGAHLFDAVEYLEGEQVWHRDIKPDNLGIRRLSNGSLRLVLFDFSMAGVGDEAVTAGTPIYLDPFLGSDRRPHYDAYAERYALAVTLHEMASAELPSWGDGMIEAQALDPSETVPQLAEDRFDPGLREGLVRFFHQALHRETSKRFETLKAMRDAWWEVFRELEQARPLTTPSTSDDEPAEPAEARDRAAAEATPETPLAAAGLSPRALSAAQEDLGLATVGALMRVPSTRIQRLRGVGIGPRNELLRRAREWRRRLKVAESPAAAARDAPARRGVQETGEQAPPTVDLRALGLDEVADGLLPKDTARKGGQAQQGRVLRLMLALPADDGTPSPVPAWATQQEIADQLGVTQPYVANLIRDARSRWAKSVRVVTSLRDQLVEILRDHDRVAEVSQLAAEMLARRGSALEDPSARLAVAGAAVRAAIEAEEYRENPRLRIRRRASATGRGRGARVLVALCVEDDPDAPADTELLDYAERLGRRADELAGQNPLPGTRAVLRELRTVPAPEGMSALSETRRITLAAAASAGAAVTARLELYPRDLEPARALQLAQAGAYTYEPGIPWEDLRARVLARFPEISLPEHPELYDAMREARYDVQVRDGRYVIPVSTLSTAGSGSRGPGSASSPTGALAADEVERRLDASVSRGGFLAVTARLGEAPRARAALASRDGVVAVDVAAEFVAALRELVEERGRPRWETVLAADSPDAPANAQAGFARLAAEVWQRLERRVRDAGEGEAVLLHDATPLARYTGGGALLARLADAARRAGEPPHGLWLLCPMGDPRERALLDGEAVGVQGENEQLALPRDFAAAGADMAPAQ